MKQLVILSWKSSGSSALYRRFVMGAGGRAVEWTPHFEKETLYWTKAASILGLPQVQMLDSVVPIPADRAARALTTFLDRNLGAHGLELDNEQALFEGWRRLCLANAPLFIEKSPHHLAQRAALDLMLKFDAQNPDIETRYLGLVRNPMDCLYSAYRRWGTFPEAAQQEWATCYRNLRDLEAHLGERLVIARYEDLTAEPTHFAAVARGLGVPLEGGDSAYRLHAGAIGKWRENPFYGFNLAPDVARLAMSYGYTVADLANPGKPFWPAIRECGRAFTTTISPLKKAYARARDRRRAATLATPPLRSSGAPAPHSH